MTPPTSTSGIAAFEAALERYLAWNRRDTGALVADRVGKVRFELFKGFAALAPDAAGLRGELKARNYRFTRRKGKDGKTLSPAREIRARAGSRKFLAASFIFRGQTAGVRDGQFVAKTRGGAKIGAALLRTGPVQENPYATLTSLLEGAIAQDRKHGIVDAALSRQAADMEVYAARKHAEQLAAIAGRPYVQEIRV